MNDIFAQVTVFDIQPRHSRGESADVRIRKAWVLQCPEEMNNAYAHYPAQVRKQLYRDFDSQVQKIWTDMLRQRREHSIAQGARFVRVNGFTRLQDEYCFDTDEVLLEAALIFIEKFVAEHVNH